MSPHGRKRQRTRLRVLKTPATDLTQIAHRNSGRFPDTRILGILNGDTATGPHGSRDMPIWGKTFKDVSASLSVAQGASTPWFLISNRCRRRSRWPGPGRARLKTRSPDGAGSAADLVGGGGMETSRANPAISAGGV